MSLRPSLYAIETDSFRKLLKEGDMRVLGKFGKQVDEVFPDSASRGTAVGILLGGDRWKTENSALAMVVYCLAKAQQNIQAGGGLFWESFLGSYSQWRESQPPLRYLSDGRPEMAPKFDSDWAFYALLSPEETKSLFAQIRAIAEIEETFDFEEADVWMDETEAKGLGVFFMAS